ncbi:Pentacotripeptide-repeat region of PRORP [Dillenia turbinata]|uniref:Pentacotripeptide-repeat region of PRORP n=1 Tax=Dillenia turbinata TaxID=194707 RepID=A0AAN8ZQ69_9MAGN
MEISVLSNSFHPIQARFSPVAALSAPSSPSSPLSLSQSRLQPSNVSFASSTTPPRPHSASYLARQEAVLLLQNSSDLDSALQRCGAILKVQDLNIVLRHFGKLSRWQHLVELFDWMQQHAKVNIASYSSCIKFMGKSLNPLKAVEIYDSIQDELTRSNVSVCNSVLGCLIKIGKFQSSIKLFHQMKKDGLRPDVVTYSTLLSGCIKLKDGYSKALELVQELQYEGLYMDAVIYGTLIAVCASNNQYKEAENYFIQMRNEGHTPNIFHYSSLLNSYSEEGNYQKADALVKEMKSAGLVPNKVILTTLLKVYVKGGLFEKSRELLNELEALGYAEDEIPYCLLMDGLAKAGEIQEAKSVFDEMQKKHIKSDGFSHSIMISAFCRGRFLEEAKQLARDYEATYDKYDLVILNTMLCAYCRAGEMESVMHLLRKMDELKICPDCNTFHILIKYFCKKKLYTLAYQAMKDMHNKGHQPEEDLCSMLIIHLGKSGSHSEAFDVYNMLRFSKRTMCKALHEKILHILIAGRLFKDAYVVFKDNAQVISQPAKRKFATTFMKSGNLNLVNDVMKVMHSSGYKMDQELFQIAVGRYLGQPDKKELLLQLLRWMPGHGYVVDSSTRNLILKNSHLFGRQLIAEVLSRHHMVSKSLGHQKKNK